MIPVFVVPEIFWNTAKGIRGISFFLKTFQLTDFTKLKKFSKSGCYFSIFNGTCMKGEVKIIYRKIKIS